MAKLCYKHTQTHAHILNDDGGRRSGTPQFIETSITGSHEIRINADDFDELRVRVRVLWKKHSRIALPPQIIISSSFLVRGLKYMPLPYGTSMVKCRNIIVYINLSLLGHSNTTA